MQTLNDPLGSRGAKLAILVVVVLAGWLVLRWANADEGGHAELTAGSASTRDERPAFVPLAAPQMPEKTSESAARRRVVGASRSDGDASIILRIVDAETGEAVDAARVHVRAVATSGGSEPDADDDWILSPPLEQHAAARVASSRVVASGASPLTSPAPQGKELWITARGYGWAKLSIFRAGPDHIEIPLRREALLEVEVAGFQDYSRVHVTLTTTGHENGRVRKRIRRSATSGTASFKGLERGRYSIEVSGIPASGGEAEFKTREVQLASHEHRREIFELQALWGELVLLLTEASAEQGGVALTRVFIQSQSPDVKPRLRERTVESFELLTDPEVDALAVSRARVRVPAGRSRVTVMPHGTQYDVAVQADGSVTLEKTLPRLYKKRVVFWDLRTALAWYGLVTVVIGAEPPVDRVEMDVAHHKLDDESGAIDAWMPAVPFRFKLSNLAPVTTQIAGESNDNGMSWSSGEAVPDDLRIEARSLEGGLTLKEVRALLETGQHNW